MKRLFALVLVLSLVLSTAACGSKSSAPAAPTFGTEDTQRAWKSAKDLGKVYKEGSEEVAAVTLPPSMVGNATQAVLDQGAGSGYISATLNNDGSATYILNEEQHAKMLSSMLESMEKTMQDMVDSKDYSIAKIEKNEDFSEFSVTLDTDKIGFTDQVAVQTLYVFRFLYGRFSGLDDADTVVKIYDKDGKLIDTADSST